MLYSQKFPRREVDDVLKRYEALLVVSSGWCRFGGPKDARASARSADLTSFFPVLRPSTRRFDSPSRVA